MKKPIMRKQVPPFTIKLELTEGCNLHCKFCGISSIRKKPGKFRFMTIETAKELIKQIKDAGWTPKIDCAMHGEPLMNKNATEIFRLFREAFPKIYMYVTTNGGALLAGDVTKNIDALLEHLNIIALDDYKYAKIVPKVLKGYTGKHKIFTYPDIKIYNRQNFKMRALLIFPDISQNKKIRARRFNNQAGAAGPADFSIMKQRCAKPFREIAIKHDGMVVLCCNDWRRYFRIGTIFERNITSLWNDKHLIAARRVLFNDGRTFSICHGCNSVAYRTGLLPDLTAKHTMLKPSQRCYDLLKDMESRGSDIEVYIPKFRDNKIKGITQFAKEK